MSSNEPAAACEHGFAQGSCPNEDCPGYWLERSERPAVLVREIAAHKLSRDQANALALVRREKGATEAQLWEEAGVGRPRATMRALERRGLVRMGVWEGEDYGYFWELVEVAA